MFIRTLIIYFWEQQKVLFIYSSFVQPVVRGQHIAHWNFWNKKSSFSCPWQGPNRAPKRIRPFHGTLWKITYQHCGIPNWQY